MLSPEARAVRDRFDREYGYACAPEIRAIDRAVFGCDFGGTSWTTRAEADRVAELLRLGPGIRLLDLGAGAGWPGLYLARETGCDVTLADLPPEGLRVAARRIAADRLTSSCTTVAADGGALPFADGHFDSVAHSDVLCCLQAKSAVLQECRRVIRRAGITAFSVISIAPGLSAEEHRRATEAGPPFKAVSSEYPAMLSGAKWRLVQLVDLTDEYARAVGRIITEEQARATALGRLLGAAEFAERLARRRRTLQAIEVGRLRREMFVAVAID